jgi:hypothetical protein
MVERSIEHFKHACPPSQTETAGSAITPDRFVVVMPKPAVSSS